MKNRLITNLNYIMENRQITRRVCLLLMTLCSFTVVFAQIAISGRVMDESKEPIIGANIKVKGGTTGTISDMDGRFKLSVPKSSSVLVISFIGYATKEVTVGNQKVLNVTLKEDGVALDEVVAVGYATVKKSDLTGSVAKVDMNDLTKAQVDSYLCTDGRPVSTTTSHYGGDKNMYGQFRDRDYRLYLTICPPYMVKKENGPSTADWKYTDNAQDREFIDLMATISGETYHRLPSSNFKGFTVQGQPHFKNMNWGQGWNASQMGFWVWKYYNTHTVATNANGVNTTDAPLFRIGEVMVNYAEAMCELNKLDQDAADKSINKLRARANVAKMVVNDINDAFDPKRDPSVPALLWEVRRERRVELMGEGFRLDDLRRWKKGDYVNKQPLGAYVTGASAKNLKVTGGTGADEGYVYFFDTPLGWQEHYYLYPLPLKQLALNTNLEQNPVWTK